MPPPKEFILGFAAIVIFGPDLVLEMLYSPGPGF